MFSYYLFDLGMPLLSHVNTCKIYFYVTSLFYHKLRKVIRFLCKLN